MITAFVAVIVVGAIVIYNALNARDAADGSGRKG